MNIVFTRVLEEQFNSWLRENEIDTRSKYQDKDQDHQLLDPESNIPWIKD